MLQLGDRLAHGSDERVRVLTGVDLLFRVLHGVLLLEQGTTRRPSWLPGSGSAWFEQSQGYTLREMRGTCVKV